MPTHVGLHLQDNWRSTIPARRTVCSPGVRMLAGPYTMPLALNKSPYKVTQAAS